MTSFLFPAVALTLSVGFKTGLSPALVGPVCSILDYGAVADNKTLNTAAIQSTLDACHIANPDGATVFVPAGAYRTASISLHSNMRLHLADGAGLYGSTDPKDYAISYQWFGGHHTNNFNALIFGANLTNVAVTGSNTNGIDVPGKASIVDGVGWKWWCWARCIPLQRDGISNLWCDEYNPTNASLPKNLLPIPQGQGRPRLVNLFNCSNVTLAGFTAQNSPQWTIHVQNSRDVLIQNMTVLSPRAVGNTDGIDPESCENVKIIDSHIDVGDDGVSIKSYNLTTIGGDKIMVPCNNIVMRNLNILSRNWCIGSGTFGSITNILMEDSTIGSPDDMDPTANPVPWAIKFKSHQFYPGPIENVTVRRVRIGAVGATPWMYPNSKSYDVFALGLTYSGKAPKAPSGVPLVRNITFEDIEITSADSPGSITGLNNSCFEHLTLKNVSIRNLTSKDASWGCSNVQLSTFTAQNVNPPINCKACPV
jgi:polygalacturonase